jgi:hypothetical protein
MSDLRISGLEQFKPNAPPEFRKTKEITWQNLLQTAHPLGINNLKPKHVR